MLGGRDYRQATRVEETIEVIDGEIHRTKFRSSSIRPAMDSSRSASIGRDSARSDEEHSGVSSSPPEKMISESSPQSRSEKQSEHETDMMMTGLCRLRSSFSLHHLRLFESKQSPESVRRVRRNVRRGGGI
nr:hypothetical protein Iba_chr08eCG10610 [Ipomoea batatas]